MPLIACTDQTFDYKVLLHNCLWLIKVHAYSHITISFSSKCSLQAFKGYILHIQGTKKAPEICCITDKGKRKNGYE